MGIVDQLATLESSLISMFLESSLRLAHVINADFFILVQSPSGVRKIAGSDNLCREFAAGSLSGRGTDVRALLRDLDVPIHEERLLTAEGRSSSVTRGISPHDDNDVGRMRFDSNSLYDTSTPKSNHQPHRVRVPDNLPQLRDQINPFSSPEIPPVAASSAYSASHSNGLRNCGSEIHESNDRGDLGAGNKRQFETSSNVVAAKKSRPNETVSADDVVAPQRNNATTAKIECFDDDDVEVIPFEVQEYPDSDACLVEHHKVVQFQDPANEDFATFNGDQSSYIPEMGFDAESEFDLKPVQDYMNENPKVACILERLATGKLDLTRQSNDIRLFGSIMYDLGKMLSRLVRILDKTHPHTKKHFAQAFDIVCAGLPGLEAVSQEATSFKDTFRGLTLKAHLRCQLYSAFKNSLQRVIKNAAR